MLKSRFLVFATIIILFLAACAPGLTVPPTPTNPTAVATVEILIPVTGGAGVQSLEVQIFQDPLLRVNAIARGQLPDSGCTVISGASQILDRNTIKVNLTTTTDSSKLCAQEFKPFEYVIALDVNGLPSGKYIVNINGVQQSFELLPRDLTSFRLSLVEALNARNYELMQVMMSDSFLISYWLSEGTANEAPETAIEQLRNNLLNSSSPVTADYTKNLIELLGTDPLTLAGSGLVDGSSFLVSGMGSTGRDQAILFTAEQPNGSLYWYGLLFAKDGFIKPTPTPQPLDTNAYATKVKYVMAQKDVRIRSGPGTQFNIISYIPVGQTAKVTGVNIDATWWRVICPDGSVGTCWVSADYNLTKPTDSPLPDATAYPTNVQYIKTQDNLIVYSGPSNQFNVAGYIASGQTAKVTGVNSNANWWRVICPDGSVGACWVSADPTLTMPTDLTANAQVQSVEIQILDSYPLQFNAIARGQLPDAGCTSISGVNQTRNDNTFNIEVTTKFNPQAMCARVLTPFEELVVLDVSNLSPGTYFVNVNGIEVSFQLPEPFLPTDVAYLIAQQEASIYSAPSTQSSIIGSLTAGQITKVTGVSWNGKWWRVICLDSTIGSCWVSADSNVTKPTDLTSSADVQTLEIKIPESNPSQVSAIARGQLPDAGCTTISEIEQTREGNVFTVNVITRFDPEVLCAQIFTPFEQLISLDVSLLLPGTYIVKVNGVESSFQLPAAIPPTKRNHPLPR